MSVLPGGLEGFSIVPTVMTADFQLSRIIEMDCNFITNTGYSVVHIHSHSHIWLLHYPKHQCNNT